MFEARAALSPDRLDIEFLSLSFVRGARSFPLSLDPGASNGGPQNGSRSLSEVSRALLLQRTIFDILPASSWEPLASILKASWDVLRRLGAPSGDFGRQLDEHRYISTAFARHRQISDREESCGGIPLFTGAPPKKR